MKRIISIIAISILLAGVVFIFSACGKTGPQGPQGPAILYPAHLDPSTPVVTPEQAQINAIIDSENSYRASLGEAPLTLGLSCAVQAVSSGQWISSSSPGYNSSQGTLVLTGTSYSYLLTGGFDQADSNPGPNSVIDPEIQALFETNNYKITCNGQLVVTEDGYYNFSMSSDDGSILTIDGTQVINNDGTHSITTATGTKNLESAVVHTFNLQYAQSGGGQFALVLDMNGSLLPAANLYH